MSSGAVSMIFGHIDYEYECDVCGCMNGYKRDSMDGRMICDKCYTKLKDKKNGDE